MNQVVLRKIALSVASVGMGGLMAVILLCNICIKSPIECHADSVEVSSGDSATMGIPISSTPLVVDAMASYDGMFYEDGTYRDVMGVAAIMLRNCSDITIPYACVIVYTENCRYEFEATMLPPNSNVIIPELNCALLTEKNIVNCFGWITVSNSTQPDHIMITASEQVCVRNLSSKPVQNLVVYHRTFLQDGNFYLGGKAFTTKIPYIEPEKAIHFLPGNFAPGYSQVVWYDVKP